MTLIKSISGIRGTIGGTPGENLTPQDIVECTAAYGTWVIRTTKNPKVVIGRDGRISGSIVSALVCATLQSLGIEVVDLGLSTTPTVEMAVPKEKAGGGIILTASHNPKEWNALKFLNKDGEFISGEEGTHILHLIAANDFDYVGVDQLGGYTYKEGYIAYHIEQILALSDINLPAVRARKFKVVVDCVNSTGALALPPLLEALGCEAILIHDTINGQFAHNPEPLAEHLGDLMKAVLDQGADLGIAVDPDVDRLVFVNEDGELFGEEYTLVAVADYILQKRKGATVSNLSSTRALSDVSQKHGVSYAASAVGEVHVVKKMKETKAVIGGEGNGGIIYPPLHYGRDALVGIALFLSALAEYGKPMSFFKQSFPFYAMSKGKIQLQAGMDVDGLLEKVADKYKREKLNQTDGLKIDLEDGWIHLRKSNTEPIIRIYTEGNSIVAAEHLAKKISADIQELL